MSITVDQRLIGSSLRSPWRIERSSVETAESIRGSVELSGSSGASGVLGGDSRSRTQRGRLTGSRDIGRDKGARGWITCDPRGTWPELASRGTSGEAVGRLVEEKVGVTAGIVTRNPTGDRPPHSRSGPRKLGLHNYQTPAQRAANPVFRPQYSPASQSNNWRNQVVPMDVDAGQMDDS